MPAYYLFDVEQITDHDLMDRYRDGVFATVREFGGRYLTVGGDVRVVEGTWRPAFPVLIEFPSARHARDWYESPQYRPLREMRLRATRGHTVLIDAAPWDGTPVKATAAAAAPAGG